MTESPFDENVIVVKFGKPGKRGICSHDRLILYSDTQTVGCQLCGEDVGAYRALEIISRIDGKLRRQWLQSQADVAKLDEYKPHLKAAKHLEHMWRGGKTPCCPHCKKGITADDALTCRALPRMVKGIMD